MSLGTLLRAAKRNTERMRCPSGRIVRSSERPGPLGVWTNARRRPLGVQTTSSVPSLSALKLERLRGEQRVSPAHVHGLYVAAAWSSQPSRGDGQGWDRPLVAGRADEQADLAREALGGGEEDGLLEGDPEGGDAAGVRGRAVARGGAAAGACAVVVRGAGGEQLDVLEREVGPAAAAPAARLGGDDHV